VRTPGLDEKLTAQVSNACTVTMRKIAQKVKPILVDHE
jgi:hypothetical protein